MEWLINYLIWGVGVLYSCSWVELAAIYWYFLFLDIPRYILTDLTALSWKFASGNSKLRQEDFKRRLLREKPLASVIIPCYNEEADILCAIRSLQSQSYPNLEIIVVDDGSTDATSFICRPLAQTGEIIFLRNYPRGGKSSAANLGLSHSHGQYIITADADTVFGREAALELLAGFADPTVGAVSGNILVRNASQNLLTRLQALHYLITISVGRISSAWLNILMIASGAFSGYRRELLTGVGGWDAGPGEDADLTLKTVKLGRVVGFAEMALCYTDVPGSWKGFIRQQLRWNRSIIRFRFRKHVSILNPTAKEFHLTNLIGTLDIFFFQVVLSYSFFIYLGYLVLYFRPLFSVILLSTYIVYFLFSVFRLGLARLLYPGTKVTLGIFLYLPLYPLFSSYILRAIRAYAYLEEFIFKTSLSDPHAPRRVLEQVQRS